MSFTESIVEDAALSRFGALNCAVAPAPPIADSHESRTLAELRDTLLPKLLSGELRVPLTI